MNHVVVKFAGLMAVVVVVQWCFSVTFNSDEVSRIIATALGIGSVEAIANRGK